MTACELVGLARELPAPLDVRSAISEDLASLERLVELREHRAAFLLASCVLEAVLAALVAPRQEEVLLFRSGRPVPVRFAWAPLLQAARDLRLLSDAEERQFGDLRRLRNDGVHGLGGRDARAVEEALRALGLLFERAGEVARRQRVQLEAEERARQVAARVAWRREMVRA